jgi:transcriptional regulator with XRE-family HTH domain
MSAGYSVLFLRKVQQADRTLIGVRLALYCMDNNIPAAKIAKKLGVSRAAVYNWFSGTYSPHKRLHAQIQKLIGE